MLYRNWCPGDALPDVKRSVALGVFDGLHLGHRAVIAAARNVAPTAFAPAPTVTVLSLTGVPKTGGRLLTPEQEREQAATLGVEEWLCVPFDAVRDLSPEMFVREVLHRLLHTRTVCCGYNFRFGKHGAGDAAALRRLCAPLGIEVRVVPAVERDGTAVSSTEVRRALREGEPQRAMALLGRPYTVAFPVRPGNHLGAAWGFPTVNQPFPADFEYPRFGVYASLVVLDGVQRRAITNIGVHPTVGGTAAPQAETYIQNYTGDLYGQAPAVQLIRFLREERRFGTVDGLKAQITADIAASESVLTGQSGDRAILFDFDDTLQHRPQAFLRTAHELLRRYFPDLSDEEYAQRAQWMLTKNNHGYVDYDAYFAELCERWDWPLPAAELLAEFRCRFPFHSARLPDAVAVLQALRRRGYRLGIITNGDGMQQNLKVDAAGLRPLVDSVLVGGAEGVHKPAAEVFYRAAQRLCVAPENCVYVGDYPPNDVVGAKAAGMRPLYIDVHGRNECPDGVEQVASLSQLLDWF